MAFTWQAVVMVLVLCAMFVALMSDRVGADVVMLSALAVSMAAGIVSVPEGLGGFANEGLLTVVALFVVAEGISRTGGLDWYMSKLLGSPSTVASAQLRLIFPIAIVSAFLNNTPVVAVMIPIVTRWSNNCGIHPGQLMIPLSFASILGGTCTLIGTSTNLVVEGMLQQRYGSGRYEVGLFGLGIYGVPVALSGLAYILAFSPRLLPGGGRGPSKGGGELLVGARVMPHSKAVNSKVGESGLRDLPGLYLVRMQHAGQEEDAGKDGVSPEAVISEGDVLWFTGQVENLGDVCEEFGLQPVTAGHNQPTALDAANLGTRQVRVQVSGSVCADADACMAMEEEDADDPWQHPTSPKSTVTRVESSKSIFTQLTRRDNADEPWDVPVSPTSVTRVEGPKSIFTQLAWREEPVAPPRNSQQKTAEDVLADLQDKCRRTGSNEATAEVAEGSGWDAAEPDQVVVVRDGGEEADGVFTLGVDAVNRVGLLHDISSGLGRLRVSICRSEATVIGHRSISIWRCEMESPAEAASLAEKMDEVSTVIRTLLETTAGMHVSNRRGLAVLRGTINEQSWLVGRVVADIDFPTLYHATIIAMQRDQRPVPPGHLSAMQLKAGDILVLQVEEDSPLLQPPPPMEVKPTRSISRLGTKLLEAASPKKGSKRLEGSPSRMGSKSSIVDLEASPGSKMHSSDLESAPSGLPALLTGMSSASIEASPTDLPDPERAISTLRSVMEAASDLTVHSRFSQVGEGGAGIAPNREFLTAIRVKERSPFAGQTVSASGLRNVPGLFLVSHERSSCGAGAEDTPASMGAGQGDGGQALQVLPPEEPLGSGDVLWFAGSASAIADLRKVPGLEPFEERQVRKVDAHLHERRLVQAVVARRGPLVGRRVRDLRFRTRFGAAIVAVHREGLRVHATVADVVLHAGDVLLLEAGPSLVAHPTPDVQCSFALVAPLEDSAPPRLRLLVPSILCAVTMLAVYTAGVCSLFVAALFASAVMMLSGCLSQQEARDAVKWDVYVTIAAAFGISKALSNSGLAAASAKFLVQAGRSVNLGDAGLYVAVYLATFLISNVVTNNAAAALIFPIAADAAEQEGIDVLSMSFLLMLAASASFMSPFGYQTNLMVYGPGGYKFKDFVWFGFPMQIAQMAISVLVLTLDLGSVWVWWVIAAAGLALISVLRTCRLGAMLKRPQPKEAALVRV
mmetsp:Transcript_84289/g.233613  ORF Transcript_84289/g.233613 Transcript_84289/m.233613 type:complete len:1193 (+) Transcript_84289:75-3653(+)